jgi:Susd and RagB outer membrane lipoprotein
LREINYEYWIASLLNGPEAFANFRRSGFPVLAPNPFPGSEVPGAFINRLTYPNSEISVNSTNVQAAISTQGPDNLATKVWWAR